ncbi:DUF6585 family protein [Kitasatospora sp. NPDC001539]|uniref:DUF6585 family protein n=1 Tax=Kitasatospora sp. NPDC001539 TaxID=3154384 RepID=UPI00331D3FC2
MAERTPPAGVAEAAARHGLGAHRATHLGAQPPDNSGCCLGVVAVSAVIAVVLFAVGSAGVALVPLALLLLALLSLAIDRSTGRRNTGLRMDRFEHGLTVTRADGPVRVVRYADTELRQVIIRHTGVGGYTDYHYTLVDVDGAELELRARSDGVAARGRFTEPKVWGPELQQDVTAAQFPKALAAVRSGRRVAFGSVWVTADAVGIRDRSVPWSQVGEVRVANGQVRLTGGGSGRALLAFGASLPNLYVFLDLADELRPRRG